MKTAVFSIFIFCAASVFAKPLTLSEVVDTALENSSETKKLWYNAKRVEASIGLSKAGFYPEAHLEANYAHGQDFKFINGPDVSYTKVGVDLVLSMLLFDFGGQSAKVDAAKASLIAANWQSDFAIQKVMIAALENGYNVLHYQDAVRFAEMSEENGKKLFELARELNRVGLKPIIDVHTSESALSKIQMDVIEKRSLLAISMGKLAQSMGLDPETKIELAPLSDLPLVESETVHALIEKAHKARTDLMQKQAEAQEKLCEEECLQTDFYPKLKGFAKVGDSQYLHDKSHEAEYSVGLTLTVPIFSGFDTVYKNRMARASTQVSLQEIAALELEIAQEVLTAKCEVEASRKLLDLSEQAMKASLLAYDGVFELYRAGKEKGISDLSVQLSDLVDARHTYSRRKKEAFVALAKLAYATGSLSPYIGKA